MSRPSDPGFCRFERSPKVGHGPVRPSDLPAPRAGRVGVRTPRQAETEPDTDLRTTLAPAPAQDRPQIVFADTTARRHGTTAEKPKYPALGLSARLGTCPGSGFAYAVAPWPVAPHTHVECPYCRSRLPGPWLHGTNESDLGSRLTLDRRILALRSEFGRVARIHGRLVYSLPLRVPDLARSP